MSELFDKSIRTLELPRVLQLLSEQAVSPEAKELALAVRPETDYEDVLRLLDQTDGARAMIVLRGAPGFSGVKPVKDLLDRADRGGSLNIPELIRIGDLLYAARRAKEYFNADAAEPTALDQIFLSIHGNRFLEDKIRRCISDENTVADAASPELADIRRHMWAALAKSRQILQKIISSPSYSKVLQDNIITPGWALCGPRQGGSEGQSAGTDPRCFLHRCHSVRRADGSGAGQQRIRGITGQGTGGDRPHFGGAVR